MWFGTENGLNKYDGYTFKTFKNDPNDSTSLSNNYIYSLFLDNQGSLWVATAFGLNKYDKYTDKFKRYFNSPQEEMGANNNLIHSIFKPSTKDDDLLWLGTNNGVYQFFMDSGIFREYLTPKKIGLRPGAYGIWDFAEDRQGINWISSSSGLFRFDSQKFEVTPYHNILDISENETTTEILLLCLDKTDDLWFGTLDENHGLIRLNTKTDETVHYTHNPDDPTSLSNN